MHIFKLVINGMPNKLSLYLWRCDVIFVSILFGDDILWGSPYICDICDTRVTFPRVCSGGMETSCICMVLGCVPSLIKSPLFATVDTSEGHV